MSETTRPRTASHEAADAFLARYTAGTLAIYTLDLRLLFEWCATAGLEPLDLKRPHLERFMRHLAAPIADGGRANGPTAIARRMRAIRGYYRLAVADDLIDRDPYRTSPAPASTSKPAETDESKEGTVKDAVIISYSDEKDAKRNGIVGAVTAGSTALTAALADGSLNSSDAWLIAGAVVGGFAVGFAGVWAAPANA